MRHFDTLLVFAALTSAHAALDARPSAAEDARNLPAPAALQGEVLTPTTKIAPPGALHLDPNVFRPGPILAVNPADRERITALYREEFDLRQSTLAQLRDLGQQAMDLRDPVQIRALQEQGKALKQTLQRRHMEIGLEIARLNQDTERVAEFEAALDKLLHPEKWMPAFTVDPELQARRLRELGIAK